MSICAPAFDSVHLAVLETNTYNNRMNSFDQGVISAAQRQLNARGD